MSLHSLVLVIGVLAAFAMTCVRVHCICSLVSSVCVFVSLIWPCGVMVFHELHFGFLALLPLVGASAPS